MFIRVLTILSLILFPSTARAELQYQSGEGEDGFKFLLVSGRFSFEDELTDFEALIRAHRPELISFNSGGGNILKAMEMGRIIRQYGLATVQIRELECASSCALAFLGGRFRYAAPGSIGVHKSSFAPSVPLNTDEAVSVVQDLTADIIGYMVEMGVDPSLLQLAFKTEANDIRYLSGQEMADYGVTLAEELTETAAAQPDPSPTNANPPDPSPPNSSSTNPVAAMLSRPSAATAPPQYDPSARAALPVARSGVVRHPKGTVLMKAGPDAKSRNIVKFSNGAQVEIVDETKRWYRVKVSGYTGYMHHTWIRVDQFDASPGMLRHIQIKSFKTLNEALHYTKTTDLPLSVYLATNGWFAVTIADSYEKEKADFYTKGLKDVGAIPRDSFVTFGNAYVVQLCCATNTGLGGSSSASGYGR